LTISDPQTAQRKSWLPNVLSRLLRLSPWMLLIALGVWVALADPFDRTQLLAWGETLTGNPYAILGIIAVQALMLVLALPGSLLVWVVAPVMAPVAATATLVVGSVLGALGAWAVARRLGTAAPGGMVRHPAFLTLARASDPLSQCALRVLPGFPHSVLNYGGGILRLPLPGFLGAALVGLTMKYGLYVTAIAALVDLDADVEFATLFPLLLLAVFLLAGSWLAARLRARRGVA